MLHYDLLQYNVQNNLENGWYRELRYCTGLPYENKKLNIECRILNVECYLTIQTSNIEDANIDVIIDTNKEFEIVT